MRFRVNDSAVVGGGLFILPGEIVDASELGEHVEALLAHGAVSPAEDSASNEKPRLAAELS